MLLRTGGEADFLAYGCRPLCDLMVDLSHEREVEGKKKKHFVTKNEIEFEPGPKLALKNRNQPSFRVQTTCK